MEALLAENQRLQQQLQEKQANQERLRGEVKVCPDSGGLWAVMLVLLFSFFSSFELTSLLLQQQLKDLLKEKEALAQEKAAVEQEILLLQKRKRDKLNGGAGDAVTDL